MYNVAILLFDDAEVLDFAGPFEVFSVTSELNGYKLLNIFTITKDGKAIRAMNGLKVIPDYSFGNHPNIDILIIPGGFGTRAQICREDILEWVRHSYENSIITMSVCSGASLLGKLGLLDNIECTTHHEVMEHLRQIAPSAFVKEDRRFVDNGKIMTAGGISAGIDLSFHVIRKLFGREVAEKTAVYMEYGDWKSIQNGTSYLHD